MKRIRVNTVFRRILPCLLLPLFLSAFTSTEKPLFPDTWILHHRIESFAAVNGGCAVVLLDAFTSEPLFVHNRKLAAERGFPPGSLAKVFSAALLHMGGEAEVVHACRGKYFPPERILTGRDSRIFHLPLDKKKKMYFRCSLRKGHGSCDLARALTVSCNTYFLSAAAVHGGLVDETSALWELDVLSKKWHDRLDGRIRPEMTSFRKQASVIGEGGLLLLSPLEVAHLYRRLLTSPQKKRQREIPPATRRFLLRGLKRVVQEGTLRKLNCRNRDVEILGGKTGTATWRGERYRTHGWNVILFRYRGRDCILVTFVMRGSGGGTARVLSEEVLNHLKIRRINSFDR